MKKLLSLFAITMLLAGCGSSQEQVDVTTAPVTRAPLKIVPQDPLAMAPVHVKVEIDPTTKKPKYVLDSANYANLSNNMEKIQDHLDVDKKQIEASKHYYDSLNK